MAKILVSGRPGSGKTTVIRKVLEAAPRLAGGFVTEEVRAGGERVGFAVTDIYAGREGMLARAGRGGGPTVWRVGRYVVDVASFEGIGVRALREAMGRQGLIVIDEIGKMEMCSNAFREAVAEVMGSSRDLLATVPARRHPFVDALRARADVTVLELTASSRDALPARILEMLGLSWPA